VSDNDDVGVVSTVASSAPIDEASGRDPTTIGRYRVLRRLGAGGMGVVFAAQDPELGRTVAIKVVRERIGDVREAMRERLRREAQALARLTHPNVVSIFDVGVDGDQLYIVMQHVDGATIDEWIRARALDRRAIVALYLQAGRGLAAAHDAGLVHRDFKPANVLVESGGTVRVTDFGLARLSNLSDLPIGDSGQSPHGSMTRGDVVGTPAYMAPEQFSGGEITPATDQFGFCVALWEALVGARPFAGYSLDTIRGAVLGGRIEAPAAGAMPRAIAQTLRRGLARDPAERHHDLRALLAALAPRRRWWIPVGVGVAVVAAGTVGAVMLTGGEAPSKCASAGRAIDELYAPARRDAVHAAVTKAGSATLADDVRRRLDDRAAAWKQMRIDVCEAAARKVDRAAVTATRERCLDQQLEAMSAALGMLGAIDSMAGVTAQTAAGNALAAQACTADAVRAASESHTADPALAARAAKLHVETDAQHWDYIARNGPALADELEASGDLGLAAQAWHDVAVSSGIPTDLARDAARRAAVLAEQIGDSFLAAKAWSWAAYRASRAGDDQAADDLLGLARSAATRSGHPSAHLTVDVTAAGILQDRGDLEGAVAACEPAVAKARALDSVTELDSALLCLAHAHWDLGNGDRAIAYHAQVTEVRKADGTDNILYLDAVIKHALWRQLRGDEGQLAVIEDALAAIERVEGADSIALMAELAEVATFETEGGNFSTPEARARIDRAVAIAKQRLPADDPELARVLELQGNIAFSGGDAKAGTAAYEVALEIYDHLQDQRQWAKLAYNAADGFRLAGRCDRATPMFERIVRLSDAGDADRFVGAAARGGLGVCQRLAGQHDAAVATLETAVAALQALAEIDFATQYRIELAEAEWARGKKDEARRLAAEIRDGLADDTETHKYLRQFADELARRR